uniref:Uncharacterized protein n=1 Tax=Rhizophora mucronata TaxID=61149 RepID=A0A2P2QGQ6_RHIMU
MSLKVNLPNVYFSPSFAVSSKLTSGILIIFMNNPSAAH